MFQQYYKQLNLNKFVKKLNKNSSNLTLSESLSLEKPNNIDQIIKLKKKYKTDRNQENLKPEMIWNFLKKTKQKRQLQVTCLALSFRILEEENLVGFEPNLEHNPKDWQREHIYKISSMRIHSYDFSQNV